MKFSKNWERTLKILERLKSVHQEPLGNPNLLLTKRLHKHIVEIYIWVCTDYTVYTHPTPISIELCRVSNTTLGHIGSYKTMHTYAPQEYIFLWLKMQ